MRTRAAYLLSLQTALLHKRRATSAPLALRRNILTPLDIARARYI